MGKEIFGKTVSFRKQYIRKVWCSQDGKDITSRPQPVAGRVPDADFVPTPILQLKAGWRIEHNRFGYGNIVEIYGNQADLKAKIRFDDHGEKILILKYAKIRAVDVVK